MCGQGKGGVDSAEAAKREPTRSKRFRDVARAGESENLRWTRASQACKIAKSTMQSLEQEASRVGHAQ